MLPRVTCVLTLALAAGPLRDDGQVEAEYALLK
jgi:hypothetical protein